MLDKETKHKRLKGRSGRDERSLHLPQPDWMVLSDRSVVPGRVPVLCWLLAEEKFGPLPIMKTLPMSVGRSGREEGDRKFSYYTANEDVELGSHDADDQSELSGATERAESGLLAMLFP